MLRKDKPSFGQGRLIFDQDLYKSALNAHYRRLLKLSEATVGQPSRREIAMLDKINDLEHCLAQERELQTENWNPLREKLQRKTSSARDTDIQIGIYGIEMAMQSIATIDSAFDTALSSASEELVEVERELKHRVPPGAPLFGKGRKTVQSSVTVRSSLKNSHLESGDLRKNVAPARHVSNQYLLQSDIESREVSRMKRLFGGSHVSSEGTANKIPCALSSGVPVYFSDNRPTIIKEKTAIRSVESDQMKAEEEEQKAIGRLISSEIRERDYELFVILADRYGALPPELFCTSRNPGRLYENLIYASAALLQLWWKILWPHRKSVKEEAALLIQRVWRGCISRKTFKTIVQNEEKVKECVKRIFFKLQLSILMNWQSYANQSRKVKCFMRQMMQGMERKVFKTWKKESCHLRAARDQKVRVAVAKYLHKVLHNIFTRWSDYTRKMRKMKEMLSRHMAAIEHTCFNDWASYVKKIALNRLRLKGAIIIQKVFRGFLGRQIWESRHTSSTDACVSIQRIIRGHLARRKTNLKLRHQQKKLRKAARRIRRDYLRQKQAILVKQEGSRINRENIAMDNAGRTARDKFIKNVRSNFGMFLRGRRRRDVIADKNAVEARFLSLRDDYFAGKITLSSTENIKGSLVELAIKQVVAERVECARSSARCAFRKLHPKVTVSSTADFGEYNNNVCNLAQ